MEGDSDWVEGGGVPHGLGGERERERRRRGKRSVAQLQARMSFEAFFPLRRIPLPVCASCTPAAGLGYSHSQCCRIPGAQRGLRPGGSLCSGHTCAVDSALSMLSQRGREGGGAVLLRALGTGDVLVVIVVGEETVRET